MKQLEASVRGIEKDGLVWGASKLVAVGFGIKKLQINLVIEDDKIGLDDLQEEIAEFEDYVQSSDVVSVSSTRAADCLARQVELELIRCFIGCYAKAIDCSFDFPSSYPHLASTLGRKWMVYSGHSPL